MITKIILRNYYTLFVYLKCILFCIDLQYITENTYLNQF